jgi:hypothetical protein
MKICIFDIFSRMIDSIPTKGIFRAIEAECQMLEDDLLCERPLPLDEALSILSFYRFLKTANSDVRIISAVLPSNQVVFYQHIVQKLVDSGELPANAKKLFDKTFRSGLLETTIS